MMIIHWFAIVLCGMAAGLNFALATRPYFRSQRGRHVVIGTLMTGLCLFNVWWSIR